MTQLSSLQTTKDAMTCSDVPSISFPDTVNPRYCQSLNSPYMSCFRSSSSQWPRLTHVPRPDRPGGQP